jgi:hypothetical protein
MSLSSPELANGLTAVEAAADAPAGSPRNLSLGDVSFKATVVKCMGRTYTAAAAGGEVFITDVTDITRPTLLGTAYPAEGRATWNIVTVRGAHTTSTPDLLRAVSALADAHRQGIGARISPK